MSVSILITRIAEKSLNLFNLVADSLEGLGIVHSEVSEHLTVDLDTGLVYESHESGVREILETGSGVDTLYPESAEVALFLLAIAVSVCEALFPGIFGYCPDVAAAAVVSAGELEDFLSLGA